MTRRALSLQAAWSAALTVLLIAPLARADDAQDAAAAEMMFRDGRALLASGHVREACDKFSESKRLDPAPGTVLNLAQCYEQLGRSASAWVNYRELATLATKLGQKRRAEFATEKSAALEPSLPMLIVHVPLAHRIEGLAIEYEGTVLGPAAWETRVPVDPGPHRLGASAPGRVPWAATFEASAAMRAQVDVPLLAVAPPGEIAPPADAANARAGRPAALRTAGVATALVGGAALGTGLILAVLAKVANDRANDECGASGCSSEGVARMGRASDLATAATVVTVTGVSLLAVGIAMWWLSPASGAPSRVSYATLARGVSF